MINVMLPTKKARSAAKKDIARAPRPLVKAVQGPRPPPGPPPASVVTKFKEEVKTGRILAPTEPKSRQMQQPPVPEPKKMPPPPPAPPVSVVAPWQKQGLLELQALARSWQIPFTMPLVVMPPPPPAEAPQQLETWEVEEAEERLVPLETGPGDASVPGNDVSESEEYTPSFGEDGMAMEGSLVVQVQQAPEDFPADGEDAVVDEAEEGYDEMVICHMCKKKLRRDLRLLERVSGNSYQ